MNQTFGSETSRLQAMTVHLVLNTPIFSKNTTLRSSKGSKGVEESSGGKSKKPKVICWGCRKKGYFQRESRSSKKKEENGGENAAGGSNSNGNTSSGQATSKAPAAGRRLPARQHQPSQPEARPSASWSHTRLRIQPTWAAWPNTMSIQGQQATLSMTSALCTTICPSRSHARSPQRRTRPSGPVALDPQFHDPSGGQGGRWRATARILHT